MSIRNFKPFNGQRKRQSEEAQARQLVNDAVQTGRTGLLDRFGRRLQVGSGVLFDPPSTLLFLIDDIQPSIDPKMPPGMMQLTLSCTAGGAYQAGMPIDRITAVGIREGNVVAMYGPKQDFALEHGHVRGEPCSPEACPAGAYLAKRPSDAPPMPERWIERVPEAPSAAESPNDQPVPSPDTPEG